MSALVLPVLAASLVGSLHCVAMCGPFAAFYAGSDTTTGRARALGHVAYHFGRLVTYVGLGATAGVVGRAIDVAGAAAGIGRTAGVVAGGAMIAWAVALLLEHAGVPGARLAVPRPLRDVAVRLLTRLKGRPPLARAGLLGLATTLLPCGWLYAFAVVAASTGHALGGALVMLSFWAGTVPLLLGVGLGTQGLATRLRRHVPVVSALALLVVGLAAVFGRINAPALAAADARATLGALPTEPPCHHREASRP